MFARCLLLFDQELLGLIRQGTAVGLPNLVWNAVGASGGRVSLSMQNLGRPGFISSRIRVMFILLRILETFCACSLDCVRTLLKGLRG